mmetsp:Transcript_25079/g.80903  ORF Transcript_25079/g.80903 Transcript_25079/m.80903 type:complete len:479 (+) Transcript_25079:63-1499(+)
MRAVGQKTVNSCRCGPSGCRGWLGWCACLAAVLAGPAVAVAETSVSSSEPYVLESLFPQVSGGWTGADCATSFVVQGDGARGQRSVFLFGDTLITGFNASVPRRTQPSWMPHSTVGIIPLGGGSTGERYPVAYSIAHNSTSGAPMTLFRPETEQLPDEYWWVMQGIQVTDSGSGSSGWAGEQGSGMGGHRALLLADRILPDASSPLGFRSAGTTAIVVEDVSSSDATQWQYWSLPLTRVSDGCLSWTLALFMQPSDGNHVYIMGQSTCKSAFDPSAVLARVSRAAWQSVTRASVGSVVNETQYLLRVPDASGGVGGDGTPAQGRWAPWTGGSADLDSWLLPLFTGAPSESTVVWLPSVGVYAMATVELFGPDVYLRFAKNASDPSSWWRTEAPVYKIPAPYDDSSLYFSYAAKLHPELDCGRIGTGSTPAPPAGLVMSYNVNTKSLGTLYEPGDGPAHAYVPKFVCFPWSFVASLLGV